jgi:hypothetical protein
MSTNTKLILLGMAVVVVLGMLLQNMIASTLDKDMSVDSRPLTPDEAANKNLKDAVKNQKKFEQKNKIEPAH